jgi:hypothetical protein
LQEENFSLEYSSDFSTKQQETITAVMALSTDQYLTHHWPICIGTMKDAIGTADMIQGNSTSFVADRFGNENSSLALNGGWTQVPPGIYFDSQEFTIAVWVYPQQIEPYSRIIDFENGQSADNIALSFSSGNSLQPLIVIYSVSNYIFQTKSTKQITPNQWQFLTATNNGTNARIYLNGTLVAESNTQNYTRPFNLSRSNCYIGKSNWAHDGYSHSYLDDLRFYNKSLTQEEINELMHYHQNETSMVSIFLFFCKSLFLLFII